jgi:hypothetical protein
VNLQNAAWQGVFPVKAKGTGNSKIERHTLRKSIKNTYHKESSAVTYFKFSIIIRNNLCCNSFAANQYLMFDTYIVKWKATMKKGYQLIKSSNKIMDQLLNYLVLKRGNAHN